MTSFRCRLDAPPCLRFGELQRLSDVFRQKDKFLSNLVSEDGDIVASVGLEPYILIFCAIKKQGDTFTDVKQFTHIAKRLSDETIPNLV